MVGIPLRDRISFARNGVISGVSRFDINGGESPYDILRVTFIREQDIDPFSAMVGLSVKICIPFGLKCCSIVRGENEISSQFIEDQESSLVIKLE